MKSNYHLFGALLAVWSLLCFSTCNSDASSSTENQQTENISTYSSSPKGGYYHLKGTLADMAVTMELFDFGGSTVDQNYFRGFYRYERYGGPIALNGYLQDDGTLTLYESGGWQGKEHRLEGSWNSQTGYTGKWFNGNGEDVHSFSLQATNEGALQLSTAYYNDSLRAFPNWPVSPKLTYEVEWLMPAPKSLSEQQQIFLERAISNGILNNNTADEKRPLIPALKEHYAETVSDFMQEMNSLREDGLLDSLEVAKGGYAPDYSYNTSMQVYYNTDTLLTVGYTDYSYTGGAHGMYSTQVASYDLQGMKRLKITDILLPGYEEKVSEVLDHALRLKYGLTGNEPLSAILFDNTVLPNDNFGITSKGIFFVYVPYEIAPYVVGEIELFVSFEKISEFVREEWFSLPSSE